MKIADVFFGAQLDDSGLQRAAGTAGDKAGKTLGASISTSLKPLAAAGFGLDVGHEAFALLKEGIQGTFQWLGDSIGKASDLNETLSKSSVVFGQYAGEIEGWGSKAAQALGMSKQAAIEAAATLGNLFQGAGVAQGASADLSKSVVQLAADLGSFNNIDSSVALEKLRAGLVGEAEPLRTLGVNLTAATVEAKATELGFKKVNGVFTEGQKIQARYALIVAQTKSAQGDFARTSDQLAGSQKKVNATLEDMQAAIGKKLLPLQLAFTQAEIGTINTAVDMIDAISAATHTFDEHADKVGNAGKELGFVSDILHLMPDFFVKAVTATEGGTAAVDKLAKAYRDARDGTDGFTGSSEDARLKILATANAVDGLDVSLGLIPAAADPSAAAIDKVGKAAGDAAPKLYDMFRQYTVAITRGDVAQDTLDLYDNAKAVTAARLAVEKATPGTAAYRRAQLELTVAQGHLAQSHERLITDQLALFEIKPDRKTAAALDKYFQGLGKGILNLDAKAQDAYRSVQRLLHPATGDANVQIIIRYGGEPQRLAAGGPAKAGVPIIVGDGGRPELFVPDVNGRIVPEVPSSTAIHGSAGAVINNYVNVGGYVKVRDPFEIGNTLRRLGEFGMLTPRPEYG